MLQHLNSARARPLLLLFAGLLSGLLLPWLTRHAIWWPGLALGIALGLADWLIPRLTAPLWRATEWLGRQLGHYNGILLSALLYILVIAPLGLLLRLLHSPRQQHATQDSFYQEPEPRSQNHMKRTF